MVLICLVVTLWGRREVLLFAESASLTYTSAAHPNIITGLVSLVVNEVHALGALSNEVLCLCINDTANY